MFADDISRRRLPALFIFSLDSDAKMSLRKCFALHGNVIDLVVLKDRREVIYSTDHYHVSSSTTKVASLEEQMSRPLMGSISLGQSGHWKQTNVFEETLGEIRNAEAIELSSSNLIGGKPLSEFLYNIESLRKHGQEECD